MQRETASVRVDRKEIGGSRKIRSLSIQEVLFAHRYSHVDLVPFDGMSVAGDTVPEPRGGQEGEAGVPIMFQDSTTTSVFSR
jgi:hypothetical protein